MKKKILATLLAATMVLGLTACGGSSDSAATTTTTTTETATETATLRHLDTPTANGQQAKQQPAPKEARRHAAAHAAV